MADTQTMARPPATHPPDGGPTIAPRRSLPGGRAVVGAFLVVVAAVGVFGAYLQATAAPSTSYLAASADIPVGRVLTAGDVDTLFTAVAVDLPEQQAATTVRSAQRQALVGTVVVAPVAADDLLLRSAVAPVGTADEGVQLSFSLPPERAIAGDVAVGERVDLIGTFDLGGQESQTRVVARQVTVVATPDTSDGISGGRVVVTVQVPDLRTAQIVQHAVDVGQIAVLRGADPGAGDPAPVHGVQTDGREDGAADDGGSTS